MKKQINILLIEDNPGDAFLIEEYLSDNDEFIFNITHVINFKDALDTLSNTTFDIILLDLGLPDSDGLEALHILIEKKINTPIMVITGLDDEKVGRKAVSLGAQSYLVKGNLNSKNIQQNIFFSIERNHFLTKLHLSEKKIKQTNDLLSESNAAKDRLITIISHDLKGPFNSLLGLMEYLNDEYDSFTEEEKKKYITGVLSSAKNTRNLIENLLTWAQSQTNKIDFQPTKSNLKKLVQESIGHLLVNAFYKQISVEINVNEQIAVFVDNNMINTVFRNLISNSIKFTREGGKISINTIENKNNKITLVIKDTGVGIAKEDIPKIFDVGEGFTTPGTNDEKGTGLGMIIIKDFIEKNKGELWIESEEGIGTSVFFTLPIARDK